MLEKVKARFFLNVVVLSLIITFITSINYAESKRGVTDSTIKIGGIFDLTGPLVTTIKPLVEGIRNYTRYTNEQGGINGRKIKLTIEDDRYTISAAVAAFKKLVYRDKIFALLGPGSTGETRALMSQIMKQKLPTFPLAADRDVIEPYKRYPFMPLDTYDNEIGILFNYIIQTSKPKIPRITLCCVDAGVKVTILKAGKKWSKLLGLKIDTLLLPLTVLDTTSEILTMKRSKINYIVLAHNIPTASLLLKDSHRFKLDAKVFGTYSLTSEDIVKLAGKRSKNFFGVHPYSSWYDDNPGMAEVRKITLQYHPGTEKPYRSKNYSIGWVMTRLCYEGIRRAGKSLTNEGLVDALETFRNYDTKGICGPVTYTSKTHEGLKYDKVFQADSASGKLVPVTKWIKAPDIK